jgi:hypothetical protein
VLQFSDLIDLERPAHLLSLHQGQVRVLHVLDLLAGAALATGLTWCWRLRAVQSLGQAQRQRASPDALRPGEKVGIAESTAGHMLL